MAQCSPRNRLKLSQLARLFLPRHLTRECGVEILWNSREKNCLIDDVSWIGMRQHSRYGSVNAHQSWFNGIGTSEQNSKR